MGSETLDWCEVSRQANLIAKEQGWRKCDCGDAEGLPHCGWWFKDGKGRFASDFLPPAQIVPLIPNGRNEASAVSVEAQAESPAVSAKKEGEQ